MEQRIQNILNQLGTLEVKLGGAAHKGLFAPYGQNADIVNLTGKDLALQYVKNSLHANGYLLSAYTRGSKGVGGQVFAYLYTREQVLMAIENFPNTPSLCAHRCAIALGKCDRISMVRTFGLPIAEFPIIGLHALNQIVPDNSCPNAKYARAWEHYCNDAVKGQWVGGKIGLQIDIVINPSDE